MTLRHIMRAILPLLAIFIMASCGGPDHKDPESVAEAALKYYADEDIDGMATLLDPADKEKAEGFKQFKDMLEDMKARGIAKASSKEDRPTFEDYTLKRMKDPYGYDPNKFTNELRVVYDCSKGRDVTVELVKVDDKWYLNSFPQ